MFIQIANSLLLTFVIAVTSLASAKDAPAQDGAAQESVPKAATELNAGEGTGKLAAALTKDGTDHPAGEEPITPEQEVAIKAFVEARQNWVESMIRMKSLSVRYNNDEARSPAMKAEYEAARDVARKLMNETFQKAVELFRLRKGDYETGAMMATVLEYRKSFSIYENSREAAELLIETDVTFPFLYLIAARASFIDGKYDRVMVHYQSFVDLNGHEKLEKIDNVIANILDAYPELWAREQALREADAKADDLPRVLLETTRGPVTLELFENQAPNTVANFIKLVEDGYYDGSDFYQVVDDFIAMGGDPVGDGTGTSGRFIPDENKHPDARGFFRGSISMAVMPDQRDKTKNVPNTASSQFAIALMPFLRKDEPKTIFGRVIEGMDVVSTFRRIDPSEKKEKSVQLPPDRIKSAKVIRKRDHEYNVKYVD